MTTETPDTVRDLARNAATHLGDIDREIDDAIGHLVLLEKHPDEPSTYDILTNLNTASAALAAAIRACDALASASDPSHPAPPRR